MSQDPDLCPVCGGEAIYRCRCQRGDRRCSKGHDWHLCSQHMRMVLGAADHNRPTAECSCRPEQLEDQASGGG